MDIEKIAELKSDLIVKSGISQKTGKPYEMIFLVVKTELFGDVEILLDTRKDKAGIILGQIAKMFERKGVFD